MSVELIGINGSMLKSKYESIKNDPNIDPVCYTGSLQECLMEFSGRLCYNSGFLGKKNRPTIEYFKNIKESHHTSVFSHSMIQIRLPIEDAKQFAFELCNEPGWYFGFISRPQKAGEWVLVTMNLRFLERLQNSNYRHSALNHRLNTEILQILEEAFILAQIVAPSIFGIAEEGSLFVDYASDMRILADEYNSPGNYQWYSFRISGSRSWSHEHIRHSYESAISQQSSRFVNPSFDFVEHPLFSRAIKDRKFKNFNFKLMKDDYEIALDIMQKFAESEGMSGLQAKKQARGALARFLPHGTETSMIYTASLREWLVIFQQRISDHADEEIRNISTQCRDELLKIGLSV